MSRSSLERRLSEQSDEIRKLGRELAVADEQLDQLAAEADDARLRALVSETPLAEREHREAQRHAEVMQRARADLVARIERAERTQDELLDKLIVEQRRG